MGRMFKLNTCYWFETEEFVQERTVRKVLKAQHQLSVNILIHNWDPRLQP